MFGLKKEKIIYNKQSIYNNKKGSRQAPFFMFNLLVFPQIVFNFE